MLRKTVGVGAAAVALVTMAGIALAHGPQVTAAPHSPVRVTALPESALGPRQPAAGSVDVSAFGAQPVVLTGQDFPGWSSGPEVTARVPEPPNDYGVYNSQANLPQNLRSDCYQDTPQPDVNGATDANHNDHNCFNGSQAPVRTALTGAMVGSLRGYRWHGKRFAQNPFQVDT